MEDREKTNQNQTKLFVERGRKVIGCPVSRKLVRSSVPLNMVHFAHLSLWSNFIHVLKEKSISCESVIGCDAAFLLHFCNKCDIMML